MKYKKKPVVVEAIRWNGNNEEEICPFVRDKYYINRDNNMVIETLEGDMIASIGDFIIKGVMGEFYPCKSDIFEKTYDLVEGE